MQQQRKLIKFNVGGVRHIVSYSTLAQRVENFLTRLADNDESGAMLCVKDEKGYIFIDRNGEIFGVVLDFLRTGQLLFGPHLPYMRVQLELDFYQISQRTEPLGDQVDTFHAAIKKWKTQVDELMENIGEYIEKNILMAIEGGNLTPSTTFSDDMFHHSDFTSGNMKIPRELANSSLACALMEQYFNSSENILSKFGHLVVVPPVSYDRTMSITFRLTLKIEAWN